MKTMLDLKSIEERIQLYKSIAPDIAKGDEFINYLIEIGFFECPASSDEHGSFEGGLFEHSYVVTNMYKEMVETFHMPLLRDSSWFIIGMFHDLGILYSYNKKTKTLDKGSTETPEDGLLSLKYLEGYIDLTEEEKLGIIWSGGSYKGLKDWNEFLQVIRKYQTVHIFYSCNMIATYILQQ